MRPRAQNLKQPPLCLNCEIVPPDFPPLPWLDRGIDSKAHPTMWSESSQKKYKAIMKGFFTEGSSMVRIAYLMPYSVVQGWMGSLVPTCSPQGSGTGEDFHTFAITGQAQRRQLASRSEAGVDLGLEDSGKALGNTLPSTDQAARNLNRTLGYTALGKQQCIFPRKLSVGAQGLPA